MICTQDLWAIKSMLEDFKDYCTCEEAVDNLINEVEKEIDERDNIQKADRYRKAIEEIEKELKEDIYCESQECGCDDFEECLKCTKEYILDIISKAKDGE